MADFERFIRLATYTLEGGGLTPLLVNEIEKAVEAHRGAKVDTPALQDQRDRIKSHWNAITSTFYSRGVTLQRLHLFAYSFAGLLLEEYWELQPPLAHVAMRNYTKIFGTERQRQEAADVLTEGDEKRLDALYENTVKFAAVELLLDPQHVEKRFRAAARGESLTQISYDAGDDSRLQDIIQKDLAAIHELALFRSELQAVEHDVNTKAQKLLHRSPSTSSRVVSLAYHSTRNSSFWSLLGFDGTQSHNLDSPSSASLLGTADLLQKKSS